jgi:hypothetical protein
MNFEVADANVRPFAQARLGLGFEVRGEKSERLHLS